ncbi:MAG: UDP-N-acetylmuramoyl-L-alanine--D-glutamate ligase [Clostridiales bacterium]|nr:UDP-N-acetylmuramoyl-L-alanine--D-glutamate ligase [Clostridiales bacterium]
MIRKEFTDKLAGMKVLVVGMGKSGRAASEVLLDRGVSLAVQDSSPEEKIDPAFLEKIRSHGATEYFGCKPPEDAVFDMLVLSPGVPVDLDFIKAAEEKGTEVIGEVELAYRLTDALFVAITGTNGKTTTTSLVGEIFKASGRKTAVVGNIGEPVVTEAVKAGSDEWLITEASSFQLETTSEFRPVVSAILNLTPDHLNRHKTMEAYGAAKAKVAANQGPEEYLVINLDDSAVVELAAGTHATVVPFSRRQKIEGCGAYLDGGSIIVNDIKGEPHHICSVDDLRIIGDHNIENALAAAAVAFYAGIDAEVIGRAIAEFPGVEHRIEFSGRINEVDYYNDSKGTNVDAAVIALKALRNNIILIAGGDGKAQDFTDLAAHLNGAVSALVLLGRDAHFIEEAARKQGFTEIYNCKDMEECVRRASELARPGDKVLLSPACASWDMYDNYEQRGRHFKQCVKHLSELA